MNWLKAHWKSLTVVLVLLLGAAWYSRPVDLYHLSSEMKNAGHISLYVRALGNGGANFPIKELTPDNPAWDTVMDSVEALRFRRPPWNILLQYFDQNVMTGRQVQDGDYQVMLTLAEQDRGYTQIQFFIDKWTYASPHSTRNLPLWVSDSRETGNALAETLRPLMNEQ